jgi:hypothetical protein
MAVSRPGRTGHWTRYRHRRRRTRWLGRTSGHETGRDGTEGRSWEIHLAGEGLQLAISQGVRGQADGGIGGERPIREGVDVEDGHVHRSRRSAVRRGLAALAGLDGGEAGVFPAVGAAFEDADVGEAHVLEELGGE